MRTTVCWTEFSSYCLLYFILGDSCWKLRKSWRYILSRMTEYILLETYLCYYSTSPWTKKIQQHPKSQLKLECSSLERKKKFWWKRWDQVFCVGRNFITGSCIFQRIWTHFSFFLLTISYLLLKTSIVWHGDIRERFSIKKDCELGLDGRLFSPAICGESL